MSQAIYSTFTIANTRDTPHRDGSFAFTMPINDDEKYGKAAEWFGRNQDMSLKQAMLAAGFHPNEA